MSKTLNVLRYAAVQLRIGADKLDNVERAVQRIREAVTEAASPVRPRPRLVALPECFNSPYGTQHFAAYAEPIPDGPTSQRLAAVARELNIFLVGGTIPERDDGRLYNTCTVWSPDGQLLAKYRKMHLFDVDVQGGIRFRESDVLSAGSQLHTIDVDGVRIGLGICYDLRFEEHARLYRNAGCHMLLYPAAFNLTTGPLHWELLQRGRANDLQLYVASVSPARATVGEQAQAPGGYVAWGHSLVVDPWARVEADGGTDEGIVYADIDVGRVEAVRAQIPVSLQRRLDVYETMAKS